MLFSCRLKVYVHEDAIALIAMEDYVIPEKKAEDPKSENDNGDGNEITSDQSNHPEGILCFVVLNEKEKSDSINYNLLHSRQEGKKAKKDVRQASQKGREEEGSQEKWRTRNARDKSLRPHNELMHSERPSQFWWRPDCAPSQRANKRTWPRGTFPPPPTHVGKYFKRECA